ncbi:MAG: hypothetical protein ACE5GU_01150 [Candidatus Scalinduaceae bacterium]
MRKFLVMFVCLIVLLPLFTILGAPRLDADAQDNLNARIEAMEQELQALKDSMAKQHEIVAKDQQLIEHLEKSHEETIKRIEGSNEEIGRLKLSLTGLERIKSLLERVKIGGYGSIRFEGNDLDEEHSTFTYRRFVLTTDAHITDRLSTYFELEFERFGQIELEKKTLSSVEKPLKIVEALEGTPGSEISLEQAWLGYKLTDWLNLEMGAVLVPVGRFNIRHDDNLWNLPRRTLVDRGVPVLPFKSAWDEVGVGLTGNFEVGEKGLIDYKFYVVNGVIFDFGEKEEVLFSKAGENFLQLEIETEFTPFRGTFSKDLKNAKAFTGRIEYSPALGHEFALSAYVGRYTPDFLEDEIVTSVAFDGQNTFGGFEMEYEAVHTDWGNTRELVTSFARNALFQKREADPLAGGAPNDQLALEFKFKPVDLAQTKTGYWLEFRKPISLSNTFLGRQFENPRLIPTIRWEQVFFRHMVESVDFKDGVLTEFKTKNRTINRITAGIAYSPHPLWRMQLAGEYTWMNGNKSLDEVTNFLNAGDDDESVALMAGIAFGF